MQYGFVGTSHSAHNSVKHEERQRGSQMQAGEGEGCPRGRPSSTPHVWLARHAQRHGHWDDREWEAKRAQKAWALVSAPPLALWSYHVRLDAFVLQTRADVQCRN